MEGPFRQGLGRDELAELRVSSGRSAFARQSMVDFAAARVAALSAALGISPDAHPLCQVVRRLGRSWGERRVGQAPAYFSNIADDGGAFELSAAFSPGAPELQVYVEPQGDAPGLRSNMAAGLVTLRSIASELAAPLERWSAIEGLFFPDDPRPPFTLWLGASFSEERGLLLKVYVNPQVRGRERASGLVAEAMKRLGFERAWARVADAVVASEARAEIAILCIDLSAECRVKAYVRLPQTTVAHIEALARVAEDHRAGDAERFYAAVGESAGPFLEKPPLVEFALVDGAADAPTGVTYEFPIGSYVESDEEACRRVAKAMATFGLEADAYERAIRAFALRPLAERNGLHAHVTLRRAGGPRIAVYLTTEGYSK